MHIKKKQLELDLEQWSGSKLGKEPCQGCILSLCLFNFSSEFIMRNAGLDEETQAGLKISRGNINNPRYADDTTLVAKRN